LRSKTGWLDSLRIKNHENKDKRREYTSLLLFMEKYDMNLHALLKMRRKNVDIFQEEDIKAFISQMLELLCILEKAGIAHRDIKP
jgi:serine/threonine protein kinase